MIAKNKRTQTSERGEKNESEKLLFFSTCPKCRHKYGTEPRIVLMYLQRIYAWAGGKGKISDALQQAQDALPKRNVRHDTDEDEEDADGGF